MDADTIRNMLATVLAANARHVAARIDAGACGTERDYRWMRQCEDESRKVIDAFVADVLRLAAKGGLAA